MGVTSIAWQKPLLYTETAMPHSDYARHLMGSATIDPTGAFEAGSFASFTLTYTAGYFGIDDTGSIKIVHRFASDMGKPQFTDPQGWNYTTVEAGNGAVLHVEYDGKRNIRPWDKTLFIRVVRGYLEEGEQIIVRFGDTRQGSPGMRVQTFHEPTFEFKVLVDAFATYNYVEIEASPTISVVAGPPVRYKAVLPSLSLAGQPLRLGFKGEDKWGNPSDQAQGRYTLRSNLRMARMPESFEMAAGAYAHAIEGIVAAETGDLRLEVLHGDRVVARSNPCRVAAQAARNHYWADLHGQSEETIGTNSAEELIQFARDRAFLDAMSHQGNDFQITQEFWEHLNTLTARYDEPGRFVIFPGYEWSGNTGLGGDRNVLYLHEGRPLHRSSHALVDDLSDLDSDANSADALFQAIKDEDAVVFAHIGGRYADITLSHDPRIERSIEIHSDWGTFEWLLEDAFKQGYRVGILANSDGHKGRHGASHPGASLFGAYGGLSCLIADTLSRQSLAECLRQRRHYATTGCRAYLDVAAHFDAPARRYAEDPRLAPDAASTQVRSADMGAILACDTDMVEFEFDLATEAPIESVEVRNRMDVVQTLRPFKPADLGRRIRIVWEGSEYRGRGRQTVWDGSATLQDNAFVDPKPINFWNLDKTLQQPQPNHLCWQSLTTGGFSGVDVMLEDAGRGTLCIDTELIQARIPVADIGLEPLVFENGGIRRRLQVFRLPDENPACHLKARVQVPLHTGQDNALYLRATTEDGFFIYSSPIYIERKA
ncbi:PF12228 domain protein [Bordetella bronchiseptica GA96-01]|nr:PF12228 domain protein [Bordetella bronchiseptica OSU054]KCV44897.1 PF12228 domain protein [Bordetella bronchiseptica 345]KDC34895.1 PF12228 domain protein [Bordetella bronchiseptica GA96-01]